MNIINNKKGVSEILSFILIVLIIVIVSGMAYKFSQSVFEKQITQLDDINGEIIMKKLAYELNEIKTFDGATFSVPIEIKKGNLIFLNNQMSYQTLVKFSGAPYCFRNICYVSFDGYKKIYMNLSNSYTFEENFHLSKGNYLMTFTNMKNESKINVYFE